MAYLNVVSGVGGKQPAAFVVEARGRRLLFDIGAGPTPGARPDPRKIGRIDALLLSHAHEDHVDALDLHAAIGSPVVYATKPVWAALKSNPVPQELRRVIPAVGCFDADGFSFIVGRDGHSPGGVWYHLALGDGLNYMGDWTSESELLPFDRPPAAGLLVTDASYGDRSQDLAEQVARLAAALKPGDVLPVPPEGRGPEMALLLRRAGIRALTCPRVAAEASALAEGASGGTAAELRGIAADAVDGNAAAPDGIVVAADASAESGLSAVLADSGGVSRRFVFTGHVAPQTRGSALLETGRGTRLPWNAHPRLSDNLELAEATQAKTVVAAFCPREELEGFEKALRGRLSWSRWIRF